MCAFWVSARSLFLETVRKSTDRLSPGGIEKHSLCPPLGWTTSHVLLGDSELEDQNVHGSSFDIFCYVKPLVTVVTGGSTFSDSGRRDVGAHLLIDDSILEHIRGRGSILAF